LKEESIHLDVNFINNHIKNYKAFPVKKMKSRQDPDKGTFFISLVVMSKIDVSSSSFLTVFVLKLTKVARTQHLFFVHFSSFPTKYLRQPM